MNMMKMVRNAALAAMLFSAGVANAAVLQFTLTGDYTASWRLDSNPIPDVVGTGQGFALWDVAGFGDAVLGVADLTFYNSAVGGGLEIYDFFDDFTLLSTEGPQLYTGTESNPIFRLGTFALTEFQGTGTYSLTIAAVGAPPGPSPVPEPASGALLLGGLALLYGFNKRRSS